MTNHTINHAPVVAIREPGVTPWLQVRCPDGTVHPYFASTPEAEAFIDGGDSCTGAHTIEVQP